jgi:hypothetical protein
MFEASGDDFHIKVQPAAEGRLTIEDRKLIERLLTSAICSVASVPPGTDGDSLDRLVGTTITTEVMTPTGQVITHQHIFTCFDVTCDDDGRVVEGKIHLSPELWNQIAAVRKTSH